MNLLVRVEIGYTLNFTVLIVKKLGRRNVCNIHMLETIIHLLATNTDMCVETNTKVIYLTNFPAALYIYRYITRSNRWEIMRLIFPNGVIFARGRMKGNNVRKMSVIFFCENTDLNLNIPAFHN